MSETTFPFQSAPATEADSPIENANASGRDKRLVMAVGAVGGLLVLGVAAYLLVFSGGGSGEGTAATPPAAKAVVVKPAPQPSTATVTVTRISAKNFGTDPFKPLIADSDSGGTAVAGTTGTTASTGTTTTTGTTTSTGTTTATSPGGSSPTTTDGSAATGSTTTPVVTTRHTFRVVSVSPDRSKVAVRLDGHTYTGLEAGEVFATHFKVLVIGGNVNGFQFGDERFSVFGTKKLYIAA